ncbi:hypothetical protein B0H13DRAFT_1861909 [Mycena leptocephala]|nr:hypothetical protein B0H13DRAFT_1861909 [Mycena leptocephala]
MDTGALLGAGCAYILASRNGILRLRVDRKWPQIGARRQQRFRRWRRLQGLLSVDVEKCRAGGVREGWIRLIGRGLSGGRQCGIGSQSVGLGGSRGCGQRALRWRMVGKSKRFWETDSEFDSTIDSDIDSGTRIGQESIKTENRSESLFLLGRRNNIRIGDSRVDSVSILMTVDFDVVNRVSESMPESAVESTQNRVGQSSFDSDTIQNTESSRESVENRTGIDVDLTALTSPIVATQRQIRGAGGAGGSGSVRVQRDIRGHLEEGGALNALRKGIGRSLESVVF